MNIIEWLNSPLDASDVFICLAIWSILWNLINLITRKVKNFDLNYDLFNLGPILGTALSFSIFACCTLIVVLLISSIQAVIKYKVIFPFLIFWGVFTAFVIFFIKKFNK